MGVGSWDGAGLPVKSWKGNTMTILKDQLRNILHLEDNPMDAELIEAVILSEDIPVSITRVETREEFITALEQHSFDLILSDYILPSFTGGTALQIAFELCPETPFIFVSGAIEEEEIAELLKQGATDYVPKLGLERLVPSIFRALHEAKERIKLRHAEKELKEAYEDLEKRVEIRTNELKQANIDLQEQITERHRIEKSLIESEELYRSLVNMSPDGIAVHYEEKLIFINPAGIRLIGADNPEQIIGQSLMNFVHPDYKALVQEHIHQTQVNNKHTDPIAALFIRMDGQKIDVEVAAHPTIYQGTHSIQIMLRDITERKQTEEELKQYRKHLEELVEQRTAELQTTNQQLQKEIEEHQQSEEEKKRLEKHLRDSQKLEAIGTLAGGIAHDFNNILFAITSYAEMGTKKISNPERIKHYLRRILQASERAKELIHQILTFSRQHEQEFKPMTLTPIIKESLRLMRASLPRTIEIHKNIETTKDRILADPTQMHQVLINLCTNAGYAMRDTGGVITVDLVESFVDSEFAKTHDIKEGNYLKLTVADTGEGIEKEVMDHIFEPFFTTKPVDEGTGMGLAVVHGIVKSHDGAIIVSSEPGKGTIFDVYFPKIEEHPEFQKSIAQTRFKGEENILLIDDESMIIEALQDILEDLGYNVTASINSVGALEIFRNHPEQFDLVITDQTMPKMTGTQLTKELLRIRPDIPVIIITGFGDTTFQKKSKDIGIREYLTKPVTEQQLSHTVRQVLNVVKS